MSNIDNVLLAARAAPGLDPQTVMALANSGANAGDIPDMSQATQGFSSAQQLKTYLQSQDHGTQNQYWDNGASETEKQMLTSAGYKPPGHHFGSWWGRLTHDVTHNVVTDVVGKPVQEVANVAGSGLRAVQHEWRTVHEMAEKNVLNGDGFWGFGSNFLHPHQWANAWTETENGEKSFSLTDVARLRKTYSDVDISLAKRLVSGTAPEEILKSTDPTQQEALVTKLHSTEFQQLQEALEMAKLSPGRVLASSVGLQHHPLAFTAVSLLGDMGFDLAGDPLIIAGKANKAYKAARYLTQGGEDVARLYQTAPRVRRFMTDVASTLRDGGPGALLERHPELEPFVAEMGQRGIDNPDDAMRFFAEKADVTRTLAGKGLEADRVATLYGTRLPTLSPIQQKALDAKGILRDKIDFNSYTKSALEQQLTEGDQLSTLTRTRSSLLQPVRYVASRTAKLTSSMTEFDPNDPRAITQIQRLANTYLPARQVRDVVDKWALSTTEGAKRAVYQSLVENVTRAAGWSDEDVQRWMGRLNSAMDGNAIEASSDSLAGKAYGSLTLSQMQRDHGTIASALYENQVDDVRWGLPSFRELQAQARRAGIARATNAAVNNDKIDALMEKAWKPSVLLRLGFPLRAGGDEIAAALIREGKGPIRGRLAASSVLGQKAAKDAVDARNAFESLSAKLEDARSAVNDRNYARVLGSGEYVPDPMELRSIANQRVSQLERQVDAAADTLKSTQGDRILPIHPLARTFDALTSHLPTQIRDAINTPSDLFSQTVGDWTRRAFRDVEGRLGGKQYVDAARDIYVHGAGESSLLDLISATHNRGGGFLDTPLGARSMIKKGNRFVRAYLEPTGEFAQYSPNQPAYLSMWLRRIREIGSSIPGKAALGGLEEEMPARIAKVADALESPSFAPFREKFLRANYLSDGRVVGVDGVAARQASEDWASKVIEDVDNLFRDRQGNALVDLRDRALAAPTKIKYDHLESIPFETRPALVNGPEVVPHALNPVSALVDKGFHELVGRPMDWMARQPMFVHAYAKAKQEFAGAAERLQAYGMTPEEAESTVRNAAMHRAVDNVIPYIHDPSQRSQFATVFRNLLPFQFAQEQFIKRWAKTLYHSPDGFRKAQLLLNGFEHSAFVHTDDQGNKYIMYPGSQAVQQALTSVVSHLPGVGNISLPVPVGFSGQLRFVSPGVEHASSLSFGPLVAIPMHGLANMFPELKPAEEGLLGRGSGKSYWEQITPPTVQRLVHAFSTDPTNDQQLSTAMVQTLQYMKANGQAPPEDADALTWERFNRRVRDYSRVIMLNRAIFGFVAPAAPELQLDPQHLNEEFRSLLSSGMDVAEASRAFLELHPDASAYTVFQSQSKSGAPLPATVETAKFMADHGDFLRRYPMASGWLIPQGPLHTGKYSQAAYREQLGLQLRERKSFEQIEKDIYHEDAADEFYKTKDQRDQLLQQYAGSPVTQQVQHNWDVYSQQFLETHPLFAEEYLSSVGKFNRQVALQELDASFKDPDIPHSAQTKAIGDFVATYQGYLARTQAVAGYTTSGTTAYRGQLRAQFVQFARQYVQQHPETQAFYNKVIRPDVETPAVLRQIQGAT